MSALHRSLRRKRPIKRLEALGITHFIRIPLLNQTSSSQIQDTLWQVARDPVSATVPPLAYCKLQCLNLSVAALSLPTQEKRDFAIALLQDLAKQDWRKVSSKARSPFRPQPLIVDLIGLGDSLLRRTPSNLGSSMALYTFIKEHTGLLQSFCLGISQEFFKAGLVIRESHWEDRGGREYCQTRVIDTKGMKSSILKIKPTLKQFGLDLVPRFDARALCEKYKDVVWGKDVHLDRVCISEPTPPAEILEDEQVVGKRYTDITSITLPGVTWEPRSFEYLRIPHGQVTVGPQGSNHA